MTALDAMNGKLQRSASSIDEYGDALQRNEGLKIRNKALNGSLTECRFTVEQNESTIKRLELEFGDCWVEWGACNMSYDQCEVAVTKLQGELSRERNNFDLCKSVNKECKADKKYLKGNVTERELQLTQCQQSMTQKLELLLKEYCMVRWDDVTVIAIVVALM